MREAMAIADEILAERRRQIEAEGFSSAHDDQYSGGDLLKAVACYANAAWRQTNGINIPKTPPEQWPWSPEWWKPKGARRDLIRAAALIVAEIERLDRAAAPPEVDGFNPLGSGPEAITPRDILNIAAAQAATALEDI